MIFSFNGMRKIAVLLLSSLLLSHCSMDENCQCDSDRLGPFLPFSFGEEWPPYSFEVPVTFTPSNKVLRVGDTLSIAISMSDSLQDIIYRNISFKDSGGVKVPDKIRDIEPTRKYKLANYPFYFSLDFSEIRPDGKYPSENANEAFTVITQKGETRYNSKYHIEDHYCAYANGRYELLLKVVPKKTGTFLIDLPTYNEWPADSFPGSCAFRLKRGIRVSFNNGKSNYELAQQALGKKWRIDLRTENTSSLYNFSISRDSSGNYVDPRAFQFQYCFVVK